jgi:hypothetical protein
VLRSAPAALDLANRNGMRRLDDWLRQSSVPET